MTPSRLILRVSFFIALICVCLTNAMGQTWTQIGSLSNDLRCAYFWDPNHGVVGGVGCIYTYTNGVWKQATYPEQPDTIKSLRMLDATHLYAASGKSDVWVSVDHGATWALTGTGLASADDVYLGGDGQIHGMNLTGTGMMQGTSFARINANNCAAARDDNPKMIHSPNDGLTWFTSTTNIEGDCGYCCVADTCSGTFYTVSDGSKPELLESTDGGSTWLYVTDFGGSDSAAQDILEGANFGVLYYQTESGILRSVAGGDFLSINGPGSNEQDRRMFAFGLYNRYLIEMMGGQIWLWDGGAQYPGIHLTETAAVTTSSDCTPSFTTLTIHWSGPPDSLAVHAFTKDGATIVPSDTTLFIDSNNSYNILYYTPFTKGQQNETYYFNDSGGSVGECNIPLVLDTSFNLKLIPNPPHLTVVDSISLPYCLNASIPLTISADECDTVRIDSFQFKSAIGSYSVDRPLPVEILPGQKDTFQITGTDFLQGQYTLFIQIFGTSYSTGGEYDSTISVSMNILGNGPPSTISFTNAPKQIACATTKVPLFIHTSVCDTIWIDSLKIQDTTAAYTLDSNPPFIVLPSNRDTFWVSIRQTIPGEYVTQLQVYGWSSYTDSAFDTSFTIFYTVAPDPKSLRVIGHNLSVSNCKTSVVPLILQALPCDSTEFTACTFTVSSGIEYSSNLELPLDLPPGAADTVLLSFPPQDLSGIYFISAVVTGKYLGSPLTFSATAEIRVTFINASASLVSNVDGVSFDPISICGENDTSITFTNLDCDSIIVTGDQTVWQPGWSVNEPSFPLTLAPDSGSFTAHIHFKPTGLGIVYLNMLYGFEYDGGKTETPQLTFIAQAVPAIASLAISDSAMNFGTFSQCGNPAGDTTITITNTGCDSLALSGASVDAGNGFALVNGNDTALGPNESASYAITFADSIAGALSSKFHITGIGAHDGNTIDTTISLSATITPGIWQATINTTAIDFGTTSICEERDSSVTITNDGCEPVTITSGDFSSSQFASDGTFTFPITLAPDSEVTFPIFTRLDTTGHPTTISGALNFMLDSGAAVPPVTLTRSVTYPGTFSLSLAAETSASAKSIVPVFVLLHGTVPIQADEIDFDLVYNGNLLQFINPIQPDIIPTSQTALANSLTDQSFKMSPASDRDTIATLQFQTYLTKNDSTGIQLAHQQFLVSGVVSPPCVALMDTISIPLNFTLELSCGDSTILAAWNSEPPFTIESIQPNPAQNEIIISLSGTAQPEIEVFDVLGRIVAISPPSSLIPPASWAMRPSSFSVDVSNMPSGLYFLRLSENGYSQSRQVVVQR